jgi:branched-subunit amino acid transport protein
LSEVWITIAALAVTTGLIRSAGPVLLGGRDLPGPLQDVIALLAPALLAALVVAETIGSPTGGALDVDERLAGVTAAGFLLVRGRSTLVAIAAAAIVTAALRAIS